MILQLALRGRGYNNCCDPETTGEGHFIRMLARTEPKLCIDIGANKGAYSKALLEETNAFVVAFEPLPRAFESLQVLSGKYPSRYVAENVGVGEKSEWLELNYGSEDSELASFSTEINQIDYVAESNKNTMRAPVISLDSYVEKLKQRADSIDLLKIDTEGFEYEVLLGAQQTIAELKPKFIQIEYNRHQLFRRHSLVSLASLMPGYAAYQILPYGRIGLVYRDLKVSESNMYFYSNFVFIRGDLSLDSLHADNPTKS